MAELKDSGRRREFESGAVRDIAEGKGRCDLLPLDVCAKIFSSLEGDKISESVLDDIDHYVRTGSYLELIAAIGDFNDLSGNSVSQCLLDLAKHYEDGAVKYSARNWERGIPLHCFIDSGVRHYLKYIRGDRDEPHDRAFVWNMVGAIWTQKHHPELVDLPFAEVKSDEDSSH